jgi:hypothetical protein
MATAAAAVVDPRARLRRTATNEPKPDAAAAVAIKDMKRQISLNIAAALGTGACVRVKYLHLEIG